jgi:hypothetical protein
MSYHNISSAIQSTTNAQGEVAPTGFHYMPDGTLMADAEHARLYGEKTIQNFSLDFTDVPQNGESKSFSITGDNGSEFLLEIKNEDSYYYNFTNNTFQVSYAKLDGVIESNSYSGSITFPTVTDNDQYDIYLYAKKGTKHTSLSSRLFEDGSIDLNRSTGSNSLLLKKVIYQILDVTATLSSNSPTSTISLSGSTNDTVVLGRYKGAGKSFSLTAKVTSNAISIDRQPTENDMLALVSPVVGAAPIHIFGENIYPAVSNTDTVNGAVTSGTTVTMDTAVASKVVVGDRVTGNTALNAITATVVSLDSTYAFTLSEAVAIADGITLSFSNQMNYQWPVDNTNKLAEDMVVIAATNVLASTTLSKYQDITTVFPDTANEKEIINTEIAAVDTTHTTPTIVNGLITTYAGNIIFNKQQALALAGDTIKVGGYGPESISSLTGWDVEVSNLKAELNTITTTTTADTSAAASTTIAVASALGIAEETTQTVDMAAGGSGIKRYTLTNNTTVLDSVDGLRVGQVVRAFSSGTLVGNPTITVINEVNKTITLSTEQTFVDGATITFSNSDISGIGIDASVIDPYVSNISSLNLTSSVAQAIESGQTLTFSGSGNIVTITGNILVKKAGPLDLSLYFDVEKFLTYHS